VSSQLTLKVSNIASVIISGNNGADVDYGPWGPQHRDKRKAAASGLNTVD
jgi:hypothetical protein